MSKVLTKHDKKWHLRYNKLVEFKRNNGHCIVPTEFEQDKSLGLWVNRQRCNHTKNNLRPDRKDLLNVLGFVWRFGIALWQNDYADARVSVYDKKWHEQYTKLVEFKRKNGHCKVPQEYEQDKSFGRWVSRQRSFHNQNNIRLDRKELLDEIEFVWKADFIAARSSTKNNVRGLVSATFQESSHLFFSLLFFS